MVQSPFESLRFRLSKRALGTLLFFTFVLVSIYGYNYVQPYIGVPRRPDEFFIVFRYGVGAHNVLDTGEGTYTKDMVVDDDITIKFNLSNHDLDIIGVLLCQNDFFGLDEQEQGPWITATSPILHTLYRSTLKATLIGSLRWKDTILTTVTLSVILSKLWGSLLR